MKDDTLPLGHVPFPRVIYILQKESLLVVASPYEQHSKVQHISSNEVQLTAKAHIPVSKK